MIAGILLLATRIHLSGRRYLVLGAFFVTLAGLTEVIQWPTKHWAFIFSYQSVAALSLAFGLLSAGVKQNFQTGSSIRWHISIGVLHAVAAEIVFFAFPAIRGWRTLVLSSAWLATALPLLWVYFDKPKRVWGATIFSIPLGLASVISVLRFIFALLDMRRDDFLPEAHDSWLFLFLIVACIGTFISAIVLAIQTQTAVTKSLSSQGKIPLSLTERGLGRMERQYVLDTLSGKSVKEIAFQYNISESTVRNTLAKSYRKLGITGMVGLATLAERHTIKP
jgi:DNA-binding CsgD family transcriptional regulator